MGIKRGIIGVIEGLSLLLVFIGIRVLLYVFDYFGDLREGSSLFLEFVPKGASGDEKIVFGLGMMGAGGLMILLAWSAWVGLNEENPYVGFTTSLSVASTIFIGLQILILGGLLFLLDADLFSLYEYELKEYLIRPLGIKSQVVQGVSILMVFGGGALIGLGKKLLKKDNFTISAIILGAEIGVAILALVTGLV